MTVHRLITAAREICHRCEMGHEPLFDDQLGWHHGVDLVPGSEDVYASPERCPAGPVWAIVGELAQEAELESLVSLDVWNRGQDEAP